MSGEFLTMLEELEKSSKENTDHIFDDFLPEIILPIKELAIKHNLDAIDVAIAMEELHAVSKALLVYHGCTDQKTVRKSFRETLADHCKWICAPMKGTSYETKETIQD